MLPEPPIKHSIEVKQEESDASAEDALSIDEDDLRSKVKFSGLRWASTGVLRVFYRCWTRVAAHLFSEDSTGERLAKALHISLPDKLNMSWVNEYLAVGGRIHPEDIKALSLTGIK